MGLLSHVAGLATPANLAAASIAIFGVLFVLERWFLGPRYPSNIPLAGEPPGAKRFRLRTRLRYFTDCQAFFRETFDKYCKNGSPVVVPILGATHTIVLPPKLFSWTVAQPDRILDAMSAAAELDKVCYSLGSKKYILDGWQGDLVKSQMNPMIETIVAALDDELAYAFDSRLGTDTSEWREIDLVSVTQKAIAQASSRFTVGLPLCRNEEYLDIMNAISNDLITTAGVANVVPRVFQSVAGGIMNLVIKVKMAKFKRLVAPIYNERMELLQRTPEENGDAEPRDHFQMMLRWAQANRPDELHDFSTMAHRLAIQNFAAAHQTAIQVVNLVLNIMGSDEEFNTIATLRAEAARVLSSEGDTAHWTKAKVARMTRADSVSRETSRIHSFGGRAIMRMVMVDGLTTPEGHDLPKGTIVSFMGHMAQTDGEAFEDPYKFDPWRFSRAREAAVAAAKKDRGEAVSGAGVSFVSTGPQHLPFGHGRHACPGRFLVDFELKMIMAYLLTHYDLEFPEEYGGKRPPNRWLAEAILPPEGVKIRVKRRVV